MTKHNPRRSSLARTLAKTATAVGVLALVTTLGVGTPASAAPAAPATNPGTGGCQIASGDHTITTSDGQQRTYRVQLPPGGATSATPMVVSLHGATGSLEDQQQVSGLSEASQPDAEAAAAAQSVLAMSQQQTLGSREGFIAVFPQAKGEPQKTAWNLDPRGDDVAFINELIAYLQGSGCGRPEVTSVNGFSNGAMLVSRLLCAQQPLLFSGAAMQGGALAPLAGCAPPPSVDILVIHGQLDTVVPYSGVVSPILESLGVPVESPPVDRTAIAKLWAGAKDCPSPGWINWGPATVLDFSCYRSTTELVIYVGTGHVWNGPGTNTSELIWAALRPPRPCVAAPLGPPNPALERAINERVASDVVFRKQLTRLIEERITCDGPFRAQLERVIALQLAWAPNGPVATKLRFLIGDEIRVEPDGETARKMREALSRR